MSSSQTNCVNVAWPGWQTNAWHVGGNPGEQEYWMGSLADGMRDANGQIYMRNRYYDPATGQFTQQDPIALAGGLNAYGFAAGDPVTYSDPYGLAADSVKIGVRPLDDPTAGSFGAHAAIRIQSESGHDKVYELLNVEGKNYIVHWDASGASYPDGVVHTADDYEWFTVPTPDGMTDDEFAANVISAFR